MISGFIIHHSPSSFNLFLHNAPFWLRMVYPGFIWRMPTREKVLYLTFDDGPIPDVTEQVLETLESHHAQATFFCIGDNVRKHPSIFKKIKKEGHSVGNHTFNHLSGWKNDDARYLENVQLCARQMATETTLFRPPYGRIKRSQARLLRPEHKIVMWDVLSGDFSPNLSPERCLAKTIEYGRSGSVVLFHDSHKARRNMEYALPRMLDHFGNLGYEFRSIPMQ